MNAEKAVKEKEKGNNFFKKGEYEEAIESYTKAMKLDATSAIYPANRALCYLKLSKYKEAEEDSTIAIKLDPKYSKAYFRRASARKSLKKYPHAIDDLNKLIELEPTNKQAVAEKLSITKLLAEEFKKREEEERRLNEGADDEDDEDKENGEKGEGEKEKEEEKKKGTALAAGESAKPKDAKESKEPVSQPLKTKQAAAGLDIVESQTRYFKDKKEPSPAVAKVEEEQKRKEVVEEKKEESGEQLPESKKPKHLEKEEEEAKKVEEEEKKSDVLMPKFPDSLPRTLQEFVLFWKSYEPSAELRARLLFLLPPERIPQFFKDSMTPAFLGEIVSVLQAHGTKIDAQKTLGWMENLPSVGRFMMLRFGLTQTDKQNIKDLIDNQLKANETIRKKWKL